MTLKVPEPCEVCGGIAEIAPDFQYKTHGWICSPCLVITKTCKTMHNIPALNAAEERKFRDLTVRLERYQTTIEFLRNVRSLTGRLAKMRWKANLKKWARIMKVPEDLGYELSSAESGDSRTRIGRLYNMSIRLTGQVQKLATADASQLEELEWHAQMWSGVNIDSDTLSDNLPFMRHFFTELDRDDDTELDVLRKQNEEVRAKELAEMTKHRLEKS